MRQILSNIIGNAYKFTESGSIIINVKSNIKSSNFVISVEDTGIGIEEKNQKLIFEEFTQADENIEKKYGGTGLGLIISKKIIEILGGKLSLKSFFGKGSCFELQLPLQFDNSKVSGEKNTKSLENLTVIVVDDDLNLLQLTSEVLKQNCLKVSSFATASEALETINNNDYDILITDIQMPGIDGFEFAGRIKELNYKNQPIIAITGRSDLDNKVYHNAGFTSVIRKPYSPKFLIEMIHAVINDVQIPNQIITKIEESNAQKNYSLVSLKSFLPNEDVALKEILTTFTVNTNNSLKLLENAILNQNIEETNEISHRMSPMFKQIQAKEISKLLENLEFKDHVIFENEAIFKLLKFKIKDLFIALEQEIY